MNKINRISFLLAMLTSFIISAQESQGNQKNRIEYPIWIEMMEEPNVNMEDARKAFDIYWEHNTHHKGDKSKSFERWYTINSNRLDQLGNVISAAQVKSEFQRLKINAAVEQKGSWFNYGPINVGARNNGDKRDGGRVKDISFHPTDAATYFVSCFKSGLFKTTNAGLTWIPLTDHLVEEVYTSKILPSNGNTIYIGTNLGVLKSTDGGVNWNATGLSSGKVNALLVKTNEDNVVVVGSASGIYRSTNGGTNFTLVQSTTNVEDIKIHPTNPNIMYAGTNGSTSQFFRSIDGGATWTENTSFGQGGFMKIAVTPAQPNNVYVINARDHLDQDSFEGVYVSTDSGINFTKRSSVSPCITGYKNDGAISRGQPNYNLFITVDQDNANLVYAGGVKSWKSTDGGITWIQIFNTITTYGFGLHLDQLSWAHSPLTKKLFAVNDGGVYYLNDDSKFQSITDGLPIAEVFECTQSQITATNVAGGTMHCGVKLNKDGVWLSPWGGDEATVLFDYSDDTYLYHFKYEKISRSKDGGLSFQRINSSSADRGEYTGTGVLDKSDVNTLFVGLFEVERINNARTATSSQVWDKISSFGGSTKIKKIEQSDADNNILYVSRGGIFYRSDNSRDVSPTFTSLILPVSGTVNDIATHPTNANIVYILLGSKMYKSSDKGATWTDISSGLPSVSLLEMVYDKSSDEGIYVGTDIGVYYKDSGLSSWIDYSEGLPAIRVSGMDIYYGATRADSFITVSTDGRGFWRSELNDIVAQTPVVDFSADKTSVFTEGEVQFTNASTDVQVGSFVWTFEGGEPATSLELNPKVNYVNVGSYKVSLSYINNTGTETKTIDNYIMVSELPTPVADFTVNNQNVFEGTILSFTDASENDPNFWEWTFEGGIPETSNEQHPSITYNTIGNYKVILTVTNSAGSNTKEVVDYVTVIANSGTGTLQSHYNFQGNLVDQSSYKRDLAIIGDFTPIFGTDKEANSSSSYEAPGAPNQYLTNGYKGVGASNNRTVMAWFKTTSAGSRKTMVSWGQNVEGQMFNLMIDAGTIRVEAGSCSLRSTKNGLDDNAWHHIAITYASDDGDKLKDVKIYIDGELDPNQPDSGLSYRSEEVYINTDITTNNVRIGDASYSANYYWQGSLDDVRIYSEALTLQEIIDIKNNVLASAPVANFSANATEIKEGETITFSDTSTGVLITWNWVFEGGLANSTTIANPEVTYAVPGVYKVVLTVANNDGSDTKEIIDYITVSMLEVPVANFSANKTAIEEGGKVVFTDLSTENPANWNWVFEGGVAINTTIENPEVYYSKEGNYKVTLTVTNSIGSDTKEVVDYITVTKSLKGILPNDNYTIAVQGETCRNSNNGLVNIVVKENYEYTATIVGNNVNSVANFNLTTPLKIENLTAGVYDVCITVDGYPNYEQCFTVVITQPESLSVQSKVNKSTKSITLKLSGSNSYTIQLNGNEFVTGSDEITLELDSKVNNVLKVSTDKICQGVYEEIIVMTGEEIFYPNPTTHTLNVFVAPILRNAKSASVLVNSINGLQLISNNYTVFNGTLAIDVSNLSKGVYFITVIVGDKILNHKFIKR